MRSLLRTTVLSLLTGGLLLAGGPLSALADTSPGHALPLGPSGLAPKTDLAGVGLASQQASSAINAEYARVATLAGTPFGNLKVTPGGTFVQEFTGGSYGLAGIYWTQATGAHLLGGGILWRYAVLGGPDGLLGPPLTDIGNTPDGLGHFVHFARGGSIYASPDGTFEVHGAIRAKYEAMAWERSPLGYPVSDETVGPGGVRFSRFQHGTIDWTPDTGAVEVHGFIYGRWAALGAEQSYLGLPVADEADWTDAAGHAGRLSGFQYGQLGWTQQDGVQDLPEVERHHEVIDTGAFNAISSASADLEVHSDGFFRFSGHYHDSSDFDSYNMTVTADVRAPDGSIAFLALPDSGYVTPNHRDHDWPWPSSGNCGCGFSDDLRAKWPLIRGAEGDHRMNIYHEYSSDLDGVWSKYEDYLKTAGIAFVVKLVTGSSANQNGNGNNGTQSSGPTASGN